MWRTSRTRTRRFVSCGAARARTRASSEGTTREVGLPAVRGDLLGQDQRGDDGEEGPRAAPGRVGPPRSGPDEGTLPRRDRGVAAAQRGRAPRARQHRHGRHRRRARARGRGGRTSSGAIEEARGAPRRRRAVRAGEAEAARVRGRPGREARGWVSIGPEIARSDFDRDRFAAAHGDGGAGGGGGATGDGDGGGARGAHALPRHPRIESLRPRTPPFARGGTTRP